MIQNQINFLTLKFTFKSTDDFKMQRLQAVRCFINQKINSILTKFMKFFFSTIIRRIVIKQKPFSISCMSNERIKFIYKFEKTKAFMSDFELKIIKTE